MSGLNQIAGSCNCGPPGVTCVTCTGTIPSTLSITDVLGTYTATWNSTLSLWITPRLCSVSSTSPTAKCTSGTGACNGGAHAAGALYTYSIGCTSSGHMTLNRYWYELTCLLPSYQYSPCNCSPGGPQAYSSSGSVSVTCGSISWSGTLTKVSGNLSDPVGGSAELLAIRRSTTENTENSKLNLRQSTTESTENTEKKIKSIVFFLRVLCALCGWHSCPLSFCKPS